jgi:multiple sugar transport system substrate-binding protein
MKKGLVLTLAAVLFVSILAGCGGAGGEATSGGAPKTGAKEVKEQKPVKLVLWGQANVPSDEIFQELFLKPVKAKYPYIDLELVRTPLKDLVTQGSVPDILIQSLLSFQGLKDFGLTYDLSPLIKKYNFDLNRIEPGLIKQVQADSDSGQIDGIPYFVNFNTMYYNKDIFDNFGVAYPRDGMNWDQVIELAKKMTRTEGGVDYRGLDPENINRLAWLMGLGYIDPKTNKPLVESWKPAFELLQKIISIPGNKPKGKMPMWDYDAFFKVHDTAMRISTNEFEIIKEIPDLNWDMVTYPEWSDRKTAPGLAGGKALLIANTSEHKEDAFQVIASVLSDDVQKEFNRRGNLSPLTSKEVQAEFGKLPYLKGKNVMSVFKQKPGWYAVTEYDDYVKKVAFNHSMDLYKGTKDVNTVIREADDEMTKIIEEKKATK